MKIRSLHEIFAYFLPKKKREEVYSRLKVESHTREKQVYSVPVGEKTPEEVQEILSDMLKSFKEKTKIVISIDHEADRRDLEFIAFSKIDKRPIYRYVGHDFANFDLPYEEVFVEDLETRVLPPVPPRDRTVLF